jgi:cell wall-associated NlpC family hydrolase
MAAKRRLAAAALAALLAAAPVVSATPALASPESLASPEGSSSLDWAEAHTLGCWYSYGGASCSPGYDCSGLVSTAVRDATGIWLGRTTYDMLRSPHLVRSYHPQRGDLVFFYGGSHVEFLTSLRYTTYGAHDSGSRVGYLHWGRWPAGTVFYWIR